MSEHLLRPYASEATAIVGRVLGVKQPRAIELHPGRPGKVTMKRLTERWRGAENLVQPSRLATKAGPVGRLPQ